MSGYYKIIIFILILGLSFFWSLSFLYDLLNFDFILERIKIDLETYKYFLAQEIPLFNYYIYEETPHYLLYNPSEVIQIILSFASEIKIDDPLSFICSEIPLLMNVNIPERVYISEKTLGYNDLDWVFEDTERVFDYESTLQPDIDNAVVETKKGSPELDQKLSSFSDQPLVGIYHSHTAESYLPTYGKERVMGEKSGKGDIVQVGEVLAKTLEEDYGIATVHNQKIHDYYPWHRSYIRSEETVKKMLYEYPSITLLFDLHRDALQIPSDSVTTTKIDGERVARILIIVGSSRLGLEHPHWQENLKFAQKLKNKMDELYPGLARGISVRSERFNQHLLERSLLLEFGDVNSTKEEAVRAAELMAEVIYRLFAENRTGKIDWQSYNT